MTPESERQKQDIYPDSKRLKAAKSREAERVRQLARVLERAEGIAVISDLLFELGLGRCVSAEELPCQRAAHALMFRVIRASEPAALEILARVFGLNG